MCESESTKPLNDDQIWGEPISADNDDYGDTYTGAYDIYCDEFCPLCGNHWSECTCYETN